MLGFFRNLLGPAKGAEVPGTLEGGGGLEILQATPRRMSLVKAIHNGLDTLTKADKEKLVLQVLSRLALWIYDLPASETNHHSGRFGLLDHTLEVAYRTVSRLSETAFRVSPDPVADHRERPSWVYAGFLGAVAHDLGKVFDVEVVLPDTDVRWQPEAEPLHAFLVRYGQLETGAGLWSFRVGRGLHSHGDKNGLLLPRILVPQAVRVAGPRLDLVLRAWRARERGEECRDVSDVVLRIVEVVQESDILSAQDGIKNRPTSSTRTAESNEVIVQAPRSPAPAVEPEPSPPGAAAGGGNDIVFKEALQEKAPALEEASFEKDLAPSANEGAGNSRPTRGDPTEQERRIEVELDPVRFLDTLRRVVLRRLLGRNGTYMDVFIRPDYVWFMVPRALIRIATLNRLFPTRRVLSRMIQSIRECPLAVPGENGNIILGVRILPHAVVRQAVRLRTREFLAETDLAKLGLWPNPVEVCAGNEWPDPVFWKMEASVASL